MFLFFIFLCNIVAFLPNEVSCIDLLQGDNVCKTFAGYYTDTGCYYNPDQTLELDQIIERYGYHVEMYDVTTEDGYILTLFRIPPKNGTGTPVYIQHGISLSAIAFADTGSNSLAFLLADEGYDVWLGNFRGNRYARNNNHLANDDIKFWDFSFHELGIHDVRAQTEFIVNHTSREIIYIGYSMGTTAAFVYSSTYPQRAKKNMKAMIHLAPVAYFVGIPSIIKFLPPIWGPLELFLNTFSHGEILNRNSTLVAIMGELCLPYPSQFLVCSAFLGTIFGFDKAQLNPETLPITLAQNADSIAVKAISHYLQILESGRFQNYDYGVAKNTLRYFSPTPPLYNLTQVIVPTYLVYGNNDALATENNVMRIYNELSDAARVLGTYKVPYETFSHDDFVSARDKRPLLYDHLLQFMSGLN